MKAVRMVAPGQALELQEIPVPEPGPGDVLVQVKAVVVWLKPFMTWATQRPSL